MRSEGVPLSPLVSPAPFPTQALSQCGPPTTLQPPLHDPRSLEGTRQWETLLSAGIPPQVSPLRLPHVLPGEGPSPGPSLEHTGLTQFPGPTESPRNLQAGRGEERRGSRGWGRGRGWCRVWAALWWRGQAWPVYEEDPDTQACTPRPARPQGWRPPGLRQTGWVRGQRAGGGVRRAGPPPQVQSRVPVPPHTHRTSCPHPTG